MLLFLLSCLLLWLTPPLLLPAGIVLGAALLIQRRKRVPKEPVAQVLPAPKARIPIKGFKTIDFAMFSLTPPASARTDNTCLSASTTEPDEAQARV